MIRTGEATGRATERTPLGWAVMAAALAVSTGPMAMAETPAAPGLGAPQSESVLLEADLIVDDETAQTITAEGDVQVRYGARSMRADRLVYDLNTGAIHAIGNVEVRLEDGSTTYAEEIDADEAMNVGAARELRARLGQTGTMAARTAIRHGPGESELRNVIYTSCPICESGDRPPTWSLRARRAIQDQDTRTISYRNAVLAVAGVPVLYIPYFAHPDPSVGRASGFLTPDLGTDSRFGAFYEQPYYWAISPSQDLTASLRVSANVAPLAGIEYRKRFWSGSVNVNTHFTQEQLFNSNGGLSGDSKFRSSLFATGRFDINDHWRWGFGAERVQDKFFLRRYDLPGAGETRGPYVGDNTRMISQLYLQGQNENEYTTLTFADFQDLSGSDTPDLLPLILPYFETEHVLYDPWLNGQVRLQANVAALTRDDNPASSTFEGNSGRVSLAATWRRDTTLGPGLIVSPFAQARGDTFRIETAPEKYESVTRALGLAGTEISWPFMRPGENFDVIVEPVAMAAYASEDADDPRIVNEDSQAFELDDSNLFRPNAAPNYDLWEPGGRVSLGMRATARAHSGESASLMFGRRWRDHAAPSFTDRSNLADQSSDWVAAGGVDLGSHFASQVRLRLDDESLELKRVDAYVRSSVGRFAAWARYFSLDSTPHPNDPRQQISGNLSVELARGWRAQFGVIRDLDSDINLRQDIRAIYEDDCTFLEIGYTRSETSAGTIGPYDGIRIRIGLRSLGVFGGS